MVHNVYLRYDVCICYEPASGHLASSGSMRDVKTKMAVDSFLCTWRKQKDTSIAIISTC